MLRRVATSIALLQLLWSLIYLDMCAPARFPLVVVGGGEITDGRGSSRNYLKSPEVIDGRPFSKGKHQDRATVWVRTKRTGNTVGGYNQAY